MRTAPRARWLSLEKDFPMRQLSAALLSVPLLATAGDAGNDRSSPPAGNWTFTLPLEPSARPMWLIQLKEKDGTWSGSVIGRSEEKPKAPEATLTGLAVADGSLRFTLRTPGQMFHFEAKLPKASGSPILGSVSLGSDVVPARLDPVTLTSLDRFAVSRNVLAREKDGPDVVRAALTLLSAAGERKSKPDEVRVWADRAVRAAEPYGKRWYRDVLLSVAEILLDQESLASEALPFARQAEKLIEEKDAVSFKKRTLDALATALERSGKAAESRQVQERAGGLDFTVNPVPYTGKRGGRVALVELFTGAQCPPCVAADLAFDALGKGFKPTEVVRLEYHLHIPGPDPLTCPDGLARKDLYGEMIEGTPTFFVNGRRTVGGGGSRYEASDKYSDLAGLVAGTVEEAAKATVKVTAARKGNQVEIKADVSDLEQTGETVRLRLALVEAEVAYTGRNGISGYQNVVRSFPGGADGTPLKAKTATKTVMVDLDALRRELTAYLDKSAAENPFPSKARPLDLKKLSVVAFVQNDETGEVLQAAQVEAGE
jgi:hypothetical protein